MQVKKLATILVVVIACMGLVGCATTPKGRYAQALDNFNGMMESYRYYYELAPPATQMEWNATITPIMAEASAALDQWRLAQWDVNKEQAYTTMYRQAMAALIHHGIVEVK